MINNGDEEISSGESSDDSVGQRTSPYQFRNRCAPRATSSRNTRISTLDRYNMLMVQVENSTVLEGTNQAVPYLLSVMSMSLIHIQNLHPLLEMIHATINNSKNEASNILLEVT